MTRKQCVLVAVLALMVIMVGTASDLARGTHAQTWIPNPGGVKFPTLLHIHQGDPRLSAAHNSMEIIPRLKLDVAQHVPIHGQPGPASQFAQIVGRGTN